MLLREQEHLVEADLSRFHHIDYRDRWRRDSCGRRILTLRRIYVIVRYGLPPDSAVSVAANDGRIPWSAVEHLLADLWEQAQNKGRKVRDQRSDWHRHPARPEPKITMSPERRRHRDAAMRRHKRRLAGQ